jgi:hypothetical protein
MRVWESLASLGLTGLGPGKRGYRRSGQAQVSGIPETGNLGTSIIGGATAAASDQ